ncbi:MAG: cobalt ECF transporter T component CbiQ [Anaerolineales bacterium]|nr:cobalt ECF transporter T component CbiQ [Anaerolineales bacterium]
MHINVFDHYHEQTTAVHRLDPRVKVVVVVLFILSNALLPDGVWLAYALMGLLIWLAARAANLSMGFLVKRSLIVLPFLLAAITIPFTLPGTTILTFHVGQHALSMSDAGLIRFISIMVRSWLSVLAAIGLTATTPFPDLLHALRHLHVPRVLIAIISFMYRYLFVLADEALRLLRARESRSARSLAGKGGGSIWWRAQVAGSMIGQLLLRSLERSDRVYNAMLARGYRGELLTMTTHEMTSRDWWVGATAVTLLLLIQVGGHAFL